MENGSTEEENDHPGLVECPQCHEMKMPHRVCPECGYYNGKEVIKTEE